MIAKTKGALIDNEDFTVHVVHCALDYLDMNPLVPADKAADVFRNLVCLHKAADRGPRRAGQARPLTCMWRPHAHTL